MDLGIDGRNAIVCASSRGLGKGCARALAEAGVSLVINGRNRQVLEQTAEEIRHATGTQVTAVHGDVSTHEVQSALLTACPAPDILISNIGGRSLTKPKELDRAALLADVEMKIVAPIELIRNVVDGMAARGFGRIVHITSVNIDMPQASLSPSEAARAGLTRILAEITRAVAEKNVTINDLVPGHFDTEGLRESFVTAANYLGMAQLGIEAQSFSAVPARRFGTSIEFGQACAFLCSVQAGYITGQSIAIDGGYYPPPV